MKFTKMHGLGNDYLYILGEVPKNVKKLAIKYSNRHFGVGSDGLVYISKSNIADFKMRIFNADGSEAKMCGNGIRCVGKYVYDKKLTNKTTLKIETLSGIKTLKLKIANNKVKMVTVDMGKVKVFDDISLNVLDKTFTLTPVNVGNPHAVIIVEDIEIFPIEKYGPLIEKNKYFKDGVNVEFVEIIQNNVRMRVWERGSGVTFACGTGACATICALAKKGLIEQNKYINITLDGGNLKIKSANEKAFMMGPAEFICEGETYD